MKMADNVETETVKVEALDSRASRMARYSAAAAGVAAVSSIEVDAAMIKVIVTDLSAQNTRSYTLDLSSITAGAKFTMNISSGSFYASRFVGASAATKSGYMLLTYKSGVTSVGPSDFPAMSSSAYIYLTSGSTRSFGFRVDRGNTNYTYGWFNVQANSNSAFTLNSYGYNSTLNSPAAAGQGSASSQVPDSGPGILGLVLIGAGAAGVRLLRKLRAGK